MVLLTPPAESQKLNQEFESIGKIKRDKKLKKQIKRIENKLNLSIV